MHPSEEEFVLDHSTCNLTYGILIFKAAGTHSYPIRMSGVHQMYISRVLGVHKAPHPSFVGKGQVSTLFRFYIPRYYRVVGSLVCRTIRVELPMVMKIPYQKLRCCITHKCSK